MNERDLKDIDKKILPTLTQIWALGIKTYQSCSGHKSAESYPSGAIWLEPVLSDEILDWLSKQKGIEQVGKLWGREEIPIIEIIFAGETLQPYFDLSCDSIIEACKKYNMELCSG